MLTFTPVTQRDIARLRRYYKSCEYQLCEYSALVKLMWRSHLHPSWAEGAGCLIVRNFIDGQYCFDYPVPGPNGDEDAALTLIEDDCRERDIPLVLSVVPQDKAERLAARYPYFRFSSPRVWRDYIYAAEDLRDFAGRRYSGQRNHINKFRKLYPDAAFRPLGKSDLRGRLHQGVRLGEKRAALRRENAPHDRQPALPRRRHGAGRQAPLRRHGGALRRHAANSYRKSPLRL